ncbi:MAG: ACT domain-containing protein, partial [bacterium]
LRDIPLLPMDEVRSEYYLRFQVMDRSGVLAAMTQVFGQYDISIQSMVQPARATHPDMPVQVIIITHEAREADIKKGLAAIAPMDFILGETQLIRIERFTG